MQKKLLLFKLIFICVDHHMPLHKSVNVTIDNPLLNWKLPQQENFKNVKDSFLHKMRVNRVKRSRRNGHITAVPSPARGTCHWTNWSPWSKCDCRIGLKDRTRKTNAASNKNCGIQGCSREVTQCTHRFPCSIGKLHMNVLPKSKKRVRRHNRIRVTFSELE